MTPQRILVTGAAGLLAFPLANMLAEEGRSVIGLDIAAPREAPRFTPVIGDVNDTHLLHRLIGDNGIDGIVHCGGVSGAMVAPDDPYRNCSVNVFGTVHLLEAARIHGVGRFIYCSSQAAYGEVEVDRIFESTPFLPVTTYGATKAACDAIVRSYAVQHGLDATSLRIGRVYGPKRRTGSIVSDMMRTAIDGRPLQLPAGRIALQYVFEQDVSVALGQALDAAHLPAHAYNISGPTEHTDEDIAARIARLIPGVKITFDERPRAANSIPLAPLDYRAAEADFGYAPAFDMDKGLQAFMDAWARKQG